MGDTVVLIEIPAIPAAKRRPRASVRFGRAVVYDDNKTNEKTATFIASARIFARAAFNGKPLEGPLRVDVLFVMPRPKSMIWKKRPMPREYHSKRPDRDNLDKQVLDALNGMIWLDDAQICAGEIQKVIAAGNELPHVLVRVETISGPLVGSSLAGGSCGDC